jgi:hypothetical protein
LNAPLANARAREGVSVDYMVADNLVDLPFPAPLSSSKGKPFNITGEFWTGTSQWNRHASRQPPLLASSASAE